MMHFTKDNNYTDLNIIHPIRRDNYFHFKKEELEAQLLVFTMKMKLVMLNLKVKM